MGNDYYNDSEQRYVDLLTNGGFKAFFGDENNKEEVMMLINIPCFLRTDRSHI